MLGDISVTIRVTVLPNSKALRKYYYTRILELLEYIDIIFNANCFGFGFYTILKHSLISDIQDKYSDNITLSILYFTTVGECSITFNLNTSCQVI